MNNLILYTFLAISLVLVISGYVIDSKQEKDKKNNNGKIIIGLGFALFIITMGYYFYAPETKTLKLKYA